MASINNIDLYSDVEDQDANFAITPDFSFEDHEKEFKWSFTMKFFESDLVFSDDFIYEASQIIDPKNPKEVYKVKLNKDRIDFDFGRAKIYVNVELKPVQALTPASTRSNRVLIRKSDFD